VVELARMSLVEYGDVICMRVRLMSTRVQRPTLPEQLSLAFSRSCVAAIFSLAAAAILFGWISGCTVSHSTVETQNAVTSKGGGIIVTPATAAGTAEETEQRAPSGTAGRTPSPTTTPAGGSTGNSGALTVVAPSPTSTPSPTPSDAGEPVASGVPTVAGVPDNGDAPTAGSGGANTHIIRQLARDVPAPNLQSLTNTGESIQLSREPDGAFLSWGVLQSEPKVTMFPFNNAVLSWNGITPEGTRLEFQLRAGDGNQVSPWFTMGTWSAAGGSSAGGQINAWGNVDVDTLRLANRASTLQYRVLFESANPHASPQLRSVSIVYSDLTKPLTGPTPVVAGGWARDLEVPEYSQLEQDPSVARSICSATSLAMVLNYWGEGKTVKDVYEGVRDARTGIFGNWPLNTAYAGTLGFDAYVDRYYSIEQLENEIAQGRPVVISIRFEPGQLENSPITSTTGHLIVVRGFTAQGDVIVNDPIAPSAPSVRRVYSREQLAKVWLDSGGIVYLVRPE